jgi:protein-tyrosine phosphatase
MLFSRKKEKETGFSFGWLQTDMHSHLIPGIDDGSPDMETSLEIIKGLSALGYQKLVTTPHILWDMYPNTTERITNGIERLRSATVDAGINIELKAAAEYYIDEHFQSQLEAKTPLLTISGNMVLVEVSMVTAPMDLQEVLFEMQIQNYQPVIAHPERYIYLSRKKEFFDSLKSAGCFFQLNLLSLIGHYGTSVQELADYLLKKNYYDFAGTDVHSIKHVSLLQKLSAAHFKRLSDSGSIKNQLL